MRKLLIVVFCSLLFSSCNWDWQNRRHYSNKVWGYVPVYSTDPALKVIRTDTARSVTNAGKIYAYQNYILQCEVGEGIHIIDNSRPSNAKRIAFIKAKGANEISVKGDFLYTNSFKDLLVIDISNISAAKEVKRMPNAFNVEGYLPTPPKTGYFECVDLTKGVVVSWKQDSLSFTNCIKYHQ